MLTDQNPPPRVNALAPFKSQSACSTYRRSAHQSRRSINPRPRHPVDMSVDYIEQNRMSLRSGSKMPATNRADYAMGKLPSLGLSRYVASDFRDDTRNPFTLQALTEKILVMRELEREYHLLSKHHNTGKLIHEKPIQTRVDRSGALRRIKEIPHRRDDRLTQKRKGSTEVDD